MATGNITGIIYLSPAFLECLELGVVFLFVFFVLFCLFFRASSMAYESSQAREV